MRTKLILCLAFGLFISFGHSLAGEPATNSEPQKLLHNWEYITFPEALPDGKYCPSFLAGYGGHLGGQSQGFRLDIMGLTGLAPGFFKTNGVSARLRRADGEIVEPTAEGKKLLNAPMYLSTFSIPGAMPDPQVMTYFPWGANTLEECWIEVSLGPERYWLEIPYGFDRNPDDPLSPVMPGGRPKLIPAMKSLTTRDHVMRWQNVHYDLGEIQNHWRLSLIQSNPFDAESEVVLYRDDNVVGKSMYLWDLHTPRTSLRLIDADGSIVNGFCTDLHEEGMRRSDTYREAPYGGEGVEGRRSWGQIEITVGDLSYRVVVPSSLYKYTHGHAPAN